MELVAGTLALCVERTRADEGEHQQRQRAEGTENSRRTGPSSARHFSSRRSEVQLEVDVEHVALGADRVGIRRVSDG